MCAAPCMQFGVRDTGMSRRLGCLTAIGVAIVLTFVSCTALTRGDTPVPDVLGHTLDLAETTLQRGGLQLGEVRYKEDAAGPHGVIIDQSPDAGDQTYVNGEVDVVISGPDLVRMPFVVGREESVARTELRHAQLRVGRVTEAFNDRYPAGAIVAQSPDDTLWAPRNSRIDIVISRGPESAPVPGIMGMPEDRAEEFILGLGFKTDVNWEYSRYMAGTVTEQFPSPGTNTKLGDEVEITVSEGAPPVEIPDVRGLEYASAADVLRSAGFVVETERMRIKNLGSDVPIVGRQYPYPGRQAPQGSGVTLVVWEE